MNNNAFCPISFRKTDEHAARLVGFFTVVILITAIVTSSWIPVLFLVLDFLARSLEKHSLSVLARISVFLLSVLKVKPRLINAGPKVFAARVGLLFSSLVLISLLSGWPVAALVIAVVFGVCAFLEAAIGFCVACRLYPLVYKFIYQHPVDKISGNTDFQI